MQKSSSFFCEKEKAIPIYILSKDEYRLYRNSTDVFSGNFLDEMSFAPFEERFICIPDKEGRLKSILLGVSSQSGRQVDPWVMGRIFSKIPIHDYYLATEIADPHLATLSFALAGYVFDRFKSHASRGSRNTPRFSPPEGVDVDSITRLASAVAMGRDLINAPANDMTPDRLAAEAIHMAEDLGASVSEIKGQALKDHFPLIHTVGRASVFEPRLVDFSWGDPAKKRVTLVGKGVCYDTGGLNLKPGNAMAMMKKDMAGAAIVLTAARMIIESNLDIHLRVLLPIVENAVSGNAFRQGDVLQSRSGLSVEVGNTDAEGRLVLADALTFAGEEETDLLIDVATLTGAARVALGSELPAFFTNDEMLASRILRSGEETLDPVWRLPLFYPYDSQLSSKIADVSSTGTDGMAGSITAALFLQRFVKQARVWAHFDVYGWAQRAQNGLPLGGNPQTARMIHHLVRKYV